MQGELRDPEDWRGLLAATFPGGSITGAPKLRAMEIIEALEPVRRGVYTGASDSLPAFRASRLGDAPQDVAALAAAGLGVESP